MVFSADEEPPKPVFEKKALNWEDDMQLYSKFLDRKVSTEHLHKNHYCRFSLALTVARQLTG